MPKIIQDESQRRHSIAVSLPMDLMKTIDEFVIDCKRFFNGKLPKNFGRSDVIRIMLERHLMTPYKLSDGSVVFLRFDELKPVREVGEEYGAIDHSQLSLNFEKELQGSTKA
jgi:hypothetical protein